MEERGSNFRNSFSLGAVILFVYVLLFEFILPINGLLPKPSFLAKSFHEVWNEYNLSASLSNTLLIIYVALIITYLIIYSTVPFLFKWFVDYKNSFITLGLFQYIPVFFVIVVFNLWFSDKLYGEFIFAMFFCLTLSLKKLFYESGNVKEEYILVAKNLGLTSMEISKQVYWKAVEPEFLKYFEKIHILVWSILLVFEFIGNANGIGKAVREALADTNLTAIIILVIIISILVVIGNIIIESFRRIFISWEV